MIFILRRKKEEKKTIFSSLNCNKTTDGNENLHSERMQVNTHTHILIVVVLCLSKNIISLIQ